MRSVCTPLWTPFRFLTGRRCGRLGGYLCGTWLLGLMPRSYYSLEGGIDWRKVCAWSAPAQPAPRSLLRILLLCLCQSADMCWWGVWAAC